jgi:hypothetical protein
LQNAWIDSMSRFKHRRRTELGLWKNVGVFQNGTVPKWEMLIVKTVKIENSGIGNGHQVAPGRTGPTEAR